MESCNDYLNYMLTSDCKYKCTSGPSQNGSTRYNLNLKIMFL